jgi:DNA replication protein DnaC
MSDTPTYACEAFSRLEQLIANAPKESSREIPFREAMATFGANVPKRFRGDWDRPTTDEWSWRLAKSIEKARKGSLYAFIGPRGTGKTRLAIEVMRDVAPEEGQYVTAMELFLRLRASFRKDSRESEMDITSEYKRAKFLIIDEIQERGESQWEDRILTHVIDARYAAMRATIIIGNLTKKSLRGSLSESIIDRLRENGGVLEMTGESFRAKLNSEK